MGIIQIPKRHLDRRCGRMQSTVSTDALGTKKEIQAPEEADHPPDCAELKYVGNYNRGLGRNVNVGVKEMDVTDYNTRHKMGRNSL